MAKNNPEIKFTPEEEERIQKAVEEYHRKERELMIEAEIRNRIIRENRGKPGYNYWAVDEKIKGPHNEALLFFIVFRGSA